MSDLGDLRRLEADIKKSEDLCKKLDEATRRIAGEGKAGSDGEIMVAAAAELGYEITVADLERASAEAEDVDDAELETVAGGIPGWGEDEHGHDKSCVTAWHCFTITLHTESKTRDVSCWSDYSCVIISHSS